MKTLCQDVYEDFERYTSLAGSILREGGTVAFPTETVYGLGANGLDESAVKKIFTAKGRPNDNPLILHISDKKDAERLWTEVPGIAKKLMDAFWPGPLSLIYFRSNIVPDAVTAGLDTVALRMPDNDIALRLISCAGVPIAAPSANASGKPSPTCAIHVMEDMDGRIDMVLDGGACGIGIESTVLSLTGTPAILRPGAVTKEMLLNVLDTVEIAPSALLPLGEGETAASPGMKHRHYAPDAEVFVARGTAPEQSAAIIKKYAELFAAGKKCIIFASEQTKNFYAGKECVTIGSKDNPITLCPELFGSLREYSKNYDVIFLEELGQQGVGLAYDNRILRASGFNIIE